LNQTIYLISHWDRFLGMMTAITQYMSPTTLRTGCLLCDCFIRYVIHFTEKFAENLQVS